MTVQKGKISVTTENIFPIIRQWLYSDRDIFIRELISNATDAITKQRRLATLGEVQAMAEDPEISVILDADKKTLTFRDNGIGMTADEIKRYINEIAYSGLVDFVEKYEGEGSTAGQNIIGHFGLGFYSAFMVADTVEIISLSCLKDAEAVHWSSHEGIEFEMGPADKSTVGTDIILHLNDEDVQWAEYGPVAAVLHKYCSFMPYPIFIDEVGAENAAHEAPESEPKRTPINDTDPLWNRLPAEISDEEYISFYKKTFGEMRDPLFWIHLNLDYPFRLKGILYFPQTDSVYENLDGRIKIYYNQVFVADNVPEIIPDFLFLLQGCLDCPDLPLNVSRSFLQDDQYVTKLSSHIIKKVADRLNQIHRREPEQYRRWWRHIGVFVKFGMMRDDKFYDRVKDALLFETTDGYLGFNELPEGKVDYVHERNALLPYVQMATAEGRPVLVMDHEIDNQFMSFIEYKTQGEVQFRRVDSELSSEVVSGEFDDAIKEKLEALYKPLIGDMSFAYKKMGQAMPVMIVESEAGRRMREMKEQIERLHGKLDDEDLAAFTASAQNEQQLVFNTDAAILSEIAKLPEDEAKPFARYLWQLAELGRGSLEGEDFNTFLNTSAELAAFKADRSEA